MRYRNIIAAATSNRDLHPLEIKTIRLALFSWFGNTDSGHRLYGLNVQFSDTDNRDAILQAIAVFALNRALTTQTSRQQSNSTLASVFRIA